MSIGADLSDRYQILQAVSRKLDLDPSVDLAEYARVTENFTGADLQALIYNAQLEAIHDAIEPITASTSRADTAQGAETQIDVWLPDFDGSAASKAARAALLEQAKYLDSAKRRVAEAAGDKPDVELPKAKVLADGPISPRVMSDDLL